MLNRLDLKYFKCFERLHLPLAPLTLLSGTNASGKSSVLQALVLLHQTMREHEWSTRLMLNGKSMQLGTVLDVVDKVHGRRSFEIGMVDGEQTYSWTFTGERNELSMSVERVIASNVQDLVISDPFPTASMVDLIVTEEKEPITAICNKDEPHPESLRHLLPPTIVTSLTNRLKNLTYITAERIGPREVYSLEDRQIAAAVGPKGEHAMSVLHWGRDDSVFEQLMIKGVTNTRLHQVEAQMRRFFPGCGLNLQPIPNVNAVTLGLRSSEETDFHRPAHVGFGLTQILPILIAALSAKKEDILLIENPEVHLHPAGQALMGQFLAEIASAGVQVIIETHSDHILNGIRRFVKSGGIQPEHIALHFFRPRSTDVAQVVSPQINTNGDLDSWPDGFFDQFDKDMNYFAGWD